VRQGSASQQEAQAEQAPEAEPQSVEPQDSARQQARGRHREGTGETGRRKERAKETERSHEPGKRSKGRTSQSPPASGSASGEPTPTAAPLTSAAEPVASTASTSAVTTPIVLTTPTPATVPAIAGTHVQVADGLRSHAARRATKARGRSATRRVVPGVAAGLSVAAPAAKAGTGSHNGRDRTIRPSSSDAAKSGRPSPLATTITRIVDVVPTPVRLLIAGLLALALVLAVRSRLAALRARSLERQRVALLEDVGVLQAALLPVVPARLGPVGTSVAYKPAAGPGAGGDFYDVFALEDGQLAVIVGDVSGHGRQALPHTALLRFTLRAYLEAGLSPRDAVQTAGAVLEHQLGEQFATVVVAIYDPRERVLVYACAGHPAPVVLASKPGGGRVAHVGICSSPPIGVGMRTGTRQSTVSVPGRSQICFHTDGVTEARVGSELFGSERLVQTLTELGPQATASAVLGSVVEQADARPDDMAACLLCLEGGVDVPTALVEELELDRDTATSERTERFLLACGIEPDEVAAVIDSAHAAAGRAGTVVLECRYTAQSPQVTLRHDQLAYLHVRRAGVEVAR
jgi:Stage II sporulation protein E (SpoIIE)